MRRIARSASTYDVPEGWSTNPGPEVPTAVITSPADDGTAFGMVSITGTADHENFGAYTLSYRRADETSFTEFHRSTTSVVDGELGVWDTSLLRNDEYVIRLQVATTEGTANVVEHNVGLSGELKLGNFQLSFTDMVIPVAGIPIEITRIYDTLDANVEGDFGYGWRLEYRNTDLRVGLPQSGLEDIGIYSALRPGVKVFLNVPGEGRQGFTFNPDIRVLPGFGGNNLVLARPRFTPNPGVTSTLSTGTSSYLQVNERGELYGPGGIPYNPASPDFGGAYVLTTREGITYRIDGVNGELVSASDRNGNALTFAEDAIRSSSGLSVLVERDAAGRIQAISDTTGDKFSYEYDGRGVLVKTIDRNGNVAEFEYSDDRVLTEVVDPLGNTGVRTEYDESGRIVSVTDAQGNRVSTSTDLLANLQVVTDPLGNQTIYQYDNRGNTIATIDARGYRETNTFDADNNLLSATDALGRVTRFTYDNWSNLTSVQTPEGTAMEYAYSDARFAQLSSITDTMGVTTRFTYDGKGNLTDSGTTGGMQLESEVDDRGQIVAKSNAFGGEERYEYDEFGRRLLFEDSEGRSTRSTFDRDGHLLRAERTQTIAGETLEFEETYRYDANGNMIQSVDRLGNTTLYTYDFNNNPVSITDALGRVTRYTYDANQNLVETILPDATPDRDDDNPRSINEYDILGRQIS